MRTNVTFPSAGLELAAHLYTPDSEDGTPGPARVVGPASSGVKEQASGLYAERLPREGFVTPHQASTRTLKGASMTRIDGSSDTLVIGGDLQVGRIGLGAMRLTGENLWGPYPDHDAAVRFLRDAVEAGVNLIDTADVYGPHSNEQLIHEALHPYPDGLVIATKGGLVRGGRELMFDAIGNPVYLRQSVHLSARRLGLERIDLYYLHTGRATDVPFEQQVETLAALRDEGLIRHIGLSNVTVDQYKAARAITPIAAITAHYNVVDRSSEPLLQAAEGAGAVFVPWQPISLLPPGVETDVNGTEHVQATMQRIAARHDVTASQVSLAWLLQKSSRMLPVPGTTDLQHLKENLSAQRLTLTTGEVEEISTLPADRSGSL